MVDERRVLSEHLKRPLVLCLLHVEFRGAPGIAWIVFHIHYRWLALIVLNRSKRAGFDLLNPQSSCSAFARYCYISLFSSE